MNPKHYQSTIGNLTMHCTFLLMFLSTLLLITVLADQNNTDADLDVSDDTKNECTTSDCIQSANYIGNNINLSKNPCVDFYEFACSKFPEKYPLPHGFNRFSSFEVREQNFNKLILEYLNNDEDKHFVPLEKMRNHYNVCRDDDTSNLFGDFSLPVLLKTVGLSMKPPFGDYPNDVNFSKIVASTYLYAGRNFLIEPDAWNTSPALVIGKIPPIIIYDLNLNKSHIDEDYPHSFASEWQNNGSNGQPIDERSDVNNPPSPRNRTIKLFVYFIKSMYILTHSRETEEEIRDINESFNEIITLYGNLQGISVRKEEPKQETMTILELQNRTDKILTNSEIQWSWSDYFEVLTENVVPIKNYIADGEKVLIMDTEKLNGIFEILATTKKHILIKSLWIMVAIRAAPFGDVNMRESLDEYRVIAKQGVNEIRKNDCLMEVKKRYEQIIGHLVTREKRHKDIREKTRELVNHVKNSFINRVHTATWIKDSMKMAILGKLTFLDQFVSFQDWLTDKNNVHQIYKAVYVNKNSHFVTFLQQHTHRWNAKLARIYRDLFNKYDVMANGYTSIWTINAVYFPGLNAMDIPLAILDIPFQGNGIEATNFGAIGVVVSHELIHSFDNNGITFNAWGEKKVWMKKKTVSVFDEKAKCFIEQYNKFYIPLAKRYVRGDFTLPENIADNGGINLSYGAFEEYKKSSNYQPNIYLPGFPQFNHDKLFTLGLANIYCENSNESFLNHIIDTDVHAPGKARVNIMMQNFPKFGDIWGCPPNSPMVVNKKCQLW